MKTRFLLILCSLVLSTRLMGQDSLQSLRFETTVISDSVLYDSLSGGTTGRFHFRNMCGDTLEVLFVNTSDPCFVHRYPKLIYPHEQGFFEFLCPLRKGTYTSSTFIVTYSVRGKSLTKQSQVLKVRRYYIDPGSLDEKGNLH